MLGVLWIDCFVSLIFSLFSVYIRATAGGRFVFYLFWLAFLVVTLVLLFVLLAMIPKVWI